jgi:thiosulfate/3-mercaptopyruvate sulfurtransferase
MTTDDSSNKSQLGQTDTSRDAKFSPDVLVSPEWVEKRLDQFNTDDTNLRLLEVDVNTAFYDAGHILGAAPVDWRDDLRSEDSRDILDADEMMRLLESCGITKDTTVVVYGDNSNWFAAHLYWQLTYYGHSDVRIMDGGREYWMDYNYPVSNDAVDYPTVEYDGTLDSPANPEVRAYRDDVQEALDTDTVLIDVRLPEEFRGDITKPPGIDEGAMRGGHIPGATNVFWAENIQPNGRFKSPDELRDLYESCGVDSDDDVIVYCRIGERSSLTWFVLEELLGYEHVRNYDGSWTEWGNMIAVPIEVGQDSHNQG